MVQVDQQRLIVILVRLIKGSFSRVPLVSRVSRTSPGLQGGSIISLFFFLSSVYVFMVRLSGGPLAGAMEGDDRKGGAVAGLAFPFAVVSGVAAYCGFSTCVSRQE